MNTFSEKIMHDIEILVGQAVFKIWIKKSQNIVFSITQEPLGLIRF